jgi:hypothetical protein
MNLPNLFVPGAAKSGTSSLHEYLNQHPQIFMSSAKEPHYFSHEDRFSRGIEDYARLFDAGEHCAFRGESSTTYMVSRKAVERIDAIIDEPRFIFILRNPIDRAYSHYWWLRGQGFETRPFREAVLADMYHEPDPNVDIKRNGVYRYYFEFGRYAKWIGLDVATFGRKAIHIVLAERLRSHPVTTVNSCFSFLHLPTLPQLNTIQSNRTIILSRARTYQWMLNLGRSNGFGRFIMRRLLSPKNQAMVLSMRRYVLRRVRDKLKSDNQYPSMRPDDRQWLQELYAEDVETLWHIAQQPFSEWQHDFPFKETVESIRGN